MKEQTRVAVPGDEGSIAAAALKYLLMATASSARDHGTIPRSPGTIRPVAGQVHAEALRGCFPRALVTSGGECHVLKP